MNIGKGFRLWLSSFLSTFLLFFIAISILTDTKEDQLPQAPDVVSFTWPMYLPPSFGSQLKNYNLSMLPQTERDFIDFYMPVMLNRTVRVSEFCARNPQHSTPMLFRMLLVWVHRSHIQPDVFWCPNFKVGYGTWIANFLRVAHFNEYNPLIQALPRSQREEAKLQPKFGASHATVNKLFPVPPTNQHKGKFFSGALRFFVVRHPFTRVLSAYRNKIEDEMPLSEDEAKYRELRKQIIQKYRSKNSKSRSPFPSFPEYVRYVIDTYRSFQTVEEWDKVRDNYLEPFWSHCRVCASDYSLILKLETMSQDVQFLSILGHFDELKDSKLEWHHVLKGKTSFDLAYKYYKKITKPQMLALHQIYKIDFEIFDYRMEKYLKIALDNSL